MSEASKWVTFETPEPRIGVITIARPERLNALNRAVLEGLKRAVAEASSASLAAVVVRGAGEKAFVAGADIAEMQGMTQQEAREMCVLGHETFDAIENLPCPVIAAVSGFALGGGCELALACDFIHASETAKFGQPEVKLGIIPGFGGTQRLPRRVGAAMAKELIYTGRVIDAQAALAIGLVNAVHPSGEFGDRVLGVARAIAEQGPFAVRSSKTAIARGMQVRLAEGNALERDAFVECFEQPERSEGMAAFLEKRPPRFSI